MLRNEVASPEVCMHLIYLRFMSLFECGLRCEGYFSI